MAITYLGAEPAPDINEETLLASVEDLAAYRTTRTFHYPNFSVKSDTGVKHVFDLKVTGRLSDLDCTAVWSIFWEGNTLRTMIGDRVKEMIDADPNYANRVEHKIHLTVSSLLEWVELKAGKKSTRSAVAKDSKIALLEAQNQQLNNTILSLMAKIDQLLSKGSEQAVVPQEQAA